MKRRNILASLIFMLLFILGMNSTTMQVEAATRGEKETAYAAYYTILSKNKITWGDTKTYTMNLQYTFTDIDNNGIDEMILYYPNGEGSYGNGGYRVYTYTDGKAKSLGKFGTLNVSSNKNLMVSDWGDTSNSRTYYYKIINGTRKSLASYKTTKEKRKVVGKYVKKYVENQGGYVYYFDFKVDGKSTTYKKCFDKIKSITKNSKEFNIHNNLEWNSYANHGIESKEKVTKYDGYTVYTGYMYDDWAPNVYKVSSSGSRRMLQHDAHIVKSQGRYLYTENNHGDFCESNLYVINTSTNKIKLLTSKSDGTVKTTSSYVYYPVFSKYEYQDYKFKIYRCKLNGTNKTALTKTISAKDIIKYTSTYVKYKKGSYQYIYYYKSGEVKKVSTVKPSVKISGGSTGGSSCTLTATTVPANSTVSWSSSNTSVATVSNGKVTAKGTGTATITAKITYSGKIYSAKKTVEVSSNKTYGSWSSWSTTAVSATPTREVKTTTLYRYYCYYCPTCGGREPFTGTSDCHKYTLSDSNWNEKWSTIPYSQCSPKNYSYTTIKRYTESLDDGKRWNFSTGNLNHTAIGTIDYGGSAVVIKKGYSYRSVSTNYYISSI